MNKRRRFKAKRRRALRKWQDALRAAYHDGDLYRRLWIHGRTRQFTSRGPLP